MASANQELPAVVAAVVVVRDCLHIICGNGAHYTWDEANGGWAECAPVPESFVGRKAAAKEARERERREEVAELRQAEQRYEATRVTELEKPQDVIVLERIVEQGPKGASLTAIMVAYRRWAANYGLPKRGLAAIASSVEALLSKGLVKKHHIGLRKTPVFVASGY